MVITQHVVTLLWTRDLHGTTSMKVHTAIIAKCQNDSEALGEILNSETSKQKKSEGFVLEGHLVLENTINTEDYE